MDLQLKRQKWLVPVASLGWNYNKGKERSHEKIISSKNKVEMERIIMGRGKVVGKVKEIKEAVNKASASTKACQ